MKNMKNLIIVVVVILLSLSLLGETFHNNIKDDNNDNEMTWTSFVSLYGKQYSSLQEEAFRRKIFERNAAFVTKWNNEQNKSSIKKHNIHLNKFSDMMIEELNNGFTKYKSVLESFPLDSTKVYSDLLNKFTMGTNQSMCGTHAQIPASQNWRNILPPVNQNSWSSAPLIATTQSISDGYAIQNGGQLVYVSKQELWDCVGSEEALPSEYLAWTAKNGGIASSQDYPSKGSQGKCMADSISNTIPFSAYAQVQSGNETELACAVAYHQPVTACIDASHSSFQFYSGGIYYEPACSASNVDHCLLITGFGVSANNQKYWILENNWGEDWGMDGFMWLARDRGNNCGISSYASLPLFSK